jgi:hypothetical protein
VPYRTAQLLAGTAQLAAASNRWTDAARLLARARALRSQSGAQLPPERAQQESALQLMLGQQLSEADLADVVASAQHMDETAALSLAREVLVDIRGAA